MRKPRQISFRQLLEMDDGSFCMTENLLQSPERRKHCIEKRELKKIIRALAKHNLVEFVGIKPPSDQKPHNVDEKLEKEFTQILAKHNVEGIKPSDQKPYLVWSKKLH